LEKQERKLTSCGNTERRIWPSAVVPKFPGDPWISNVTVTVKFDVLLK
jgi:hypothetical protein